ncbi:MAG TPA: hypothetical protein VFE03_05965 [Caulobacteraceae bacterium]|jgi:hypothetical protein|nr:hypothetical protein [Caulobacteraceae bacterium]
MTLSDLASIGSFVSGVAVVVTLIFLLLQLRQTERVQQGAMQQGRAARTVDFILRATDPGLCETIVRANKSDLTLTPVQIAALNTYAVALFWSMEDSFLQHQKGLLDAASWATEVATLKVFLLSPAWRVGWQMCRDQTSGDYRQFVDSLMRSVKPMKSFDESSVWKDLMEKQLAEVARA